MYTLPQCFQLARNTSFISLQRVSIIDTIFKFIQRWMIMRNAVKLLTIKHLVCSRSPFYLFIIDEYVIAHITHVCTLESYFFTNTNTHNDTDFMFSFTKFALSNIFLDTFTFGSLLSFPVCHCTKSHQVHQVMFPFLHWN